SYRAAFWGTLGGGALLIFWCWLIGLSLKWAVLMFAIHFCGMLLLTRMVSEAGLFVFWIPWENFLMDSAGSFGAKFLPRDVATMRLADYQMYDSAGNVMPNALQAFKIGSETGLNNRK